MMQTVEDRSSVDTNIFGDDFGWRRDRCSVLDALMWSDVEKISGVGRSGVQLTQDKAQHRRHSTG